MREFMVSVAQDARYNQAAGANRRRSASSEMIRKLLLLVSEYRDLIFSRACFIFRLYCREGDAQPRALLARRYGEQEGHFVRDFSARLLHKIVDGAIGQRGTNERRVHSARWWNTE